MYASSPLLIEALHCRNSGRPPVWLMRQAGRYMPEYRTLRQKYSLWELFHQPELAAQVTLLPIDLLGVDAAILFSDILVIAEAFGRNVQFVDNKGPVIDIPIKERADVETLQIGDIHETFAYIESTIKLVKNQLRVPLIGFCGGPFTVASYMIEPGAKGELNKTRQWMYTDPNGFHLFLDKIANASIEYLKLQIKAGVHAIQIFDSWANVLSGAQREQFSIKYLKKMIDALKPFSIPIILFARGSSLFPKELAAIGPSGISFDWQKNLCDLRKYVPAHIAVQGNLDPILMNAPQHIVKSEVQKLLDSMQGDPGFIVNLGHGVLPDASVDNVRCLVDTVKNF
ncbi:MAG TPA: uroporphyrinogen decarboxylase [Rhabdochlamydiaceae bacterium]|nr:uroporphyrinogen decarboxylase [Rhabdochlamydiaceae bacterium]